MQPAIFEPVPLEAYALIDSGQGEKLERFGELLLRRPDPQALWRPRLAPAEWERAQLSFERDPESGGRGGHWSARRAVPRAAATGEPEWCIEVLGGRFWIRPSAFKHVGLFPEQATNWAFVQAARAQLASARPRLLNLFGYSGAASVLAAQAGYEVTHVDASKQAISWTLENAEASGLGRRALRVLCDDALGFLQREVRRGSRYDGILLDPPHFGRGPKGERWQLESGLAPLLEGVRAILAEQAFVILSTYAVGYSPLAFQNLFSEWGDGQVAVGELVLCEEARPTGAARRLLPAGFCARWGRGLAPLGEAPAGQEHEGQERVGQERESRERESREREGEARA